MAAPVTKNGKQSEALRAECLRRWLHGQSMGEIGAALGLVKQSVHHHLQRARQEIAADRDEWLDRTLCRLEYVQAESWRAWEASKETSPPGDPAYLHQVQHAIKQQRTLLGLDAPRKIAPTNPTGTDEYAGSIGALEVLINRTILHSQAENRTEEPTAA